MIITATLQELVCIPQILLVAVAAAMVAAHKIGLHQA
jgi:hypothetical protein